jgi:hypothetical protein
VGFGLLAVDEIVFTPEPKPSNVVCLMCKQKVHEDSMGHYCPGCDETLEPDKRPDHDLITAVLAYLDRRTPQNRLRMRKRAEELVD